MAKLGSIPLIPSIEGEREFKIDRFKMLNGETDEWREELDAFTALLNHFSQNRQPLYINMWVSDEIDYDKTVVRIDWRPMEYHEHG